MSRAPAEVDINRDSPADIMERRLRISSPTTSRIVLLATVGPIEQMTGRDSQDVHERSTRWEASRLDVTHHWTHNASLLPHWIAQTSDVSLTCQTPSAWISPKPCCAAKGVQVANHLDTNPGCPLPHL